MAVNTPTFRKTVGSVAMTATYNTIIYDYFPLVPIHNRPIYWDARYSMEWATGKVSYEHNHILSSGIGMTVIEILSKRILGGELVFKKGKDTEKASKTVDKVKKISYDHLSLNEKLDGGIKKALSGGSAYWSLQQTGDKLRLDVLNIDQVAPSFAGDDIYDAKIFINYFDNASEGVYGGYRYFLIERRYYDENGVPTTKNTIYKSVLPQFIGANEQYNFSWRDEVKTEGRELEDLENGLPEHIKHKLEEDGIVLGVAVPLPFEDLGIYHIKATSADLRHPNSKFGRPVLSGCYDLMWSYDFAYSILNKDLYVGRPITFFPATMNGNMMMSQQMSDGELGNLFYQMKANMPSLFDDEFVSIPNVSNEYQHPTTVQFDIRAEQLKTAIDTLATMIAHNVGIQPQHLISVMQQQNETKTATEISSDTSETNLTILSHRRLIQNALNKLINAIAKFYNFDSEDVFITFPPLEDLNKTLTADMIVKLRSVGGMSVERLVDLISKDMSEAEKQEEVERIKNEEKNKVDLENNLDNDRKEDENENNDIEPSDRDKE